MAATRIEIRVEDGAPGPPDYDLLLGSAAAVLALTAAAIIARRRGQSGDPEPRRLMRVLHPALPFSGAITLWLVGGEVWAPSAMGPLPLVAALSALAFAVIGLTLFGLVDFWLGLSRPRRDRRWFFLGTLGFTLAIGAAVAAAMVASGAAEEILHPLNLPVLAIAAACGMVWWAYLPPTHPDTVRIFE